MTIRKSGWINPMGTAAFALAVAAKAWPAAASADTVWMRLNNGKDMAGWNYDARYFRADSGMIIAKGAADRNTFAVSKGVFADFELRFRARLFENLGYANSGVQYRSVASADTSRHEAKGYQLELGAGGCGGFYNEGGLPANLGYKEPSAACRAAIRKNDWNDYSILADGPKVSHWLNGVKCYEMNDPTLTTGVIAIQLHQAQGKGPMEADFKELLIRPLNGSFAVPDSLAVQLGGATGLAFPSAGHARARGYRGYRLDGRAHLFAVPGTPGAIKTLP